MHKCDCLRLVNVEMNECLLNTATKDNRASPITYLEVLHWEISLVF